MRIKNEIWLILKNDISMLLRAIERVKRCFGALASLFYSLYPPYCRFYLFYLLIKLSFQRTNSCSITTQPSSSVIIFSTAPLSDLIFLTLFFIIAIMGKTYNIKLEYKHHLWTVNWLVQMNGYKVTQFGRQGTRDDEEAKEKEM